MEVKTLRTLVPLSDTNQTIADPAEDIRGRTVCDNGGEKVGTVEELLIDGEESAVRMLRVEHGGIFGFGAKSSFIPVEAVVEVGEDEVLIDQSRDQIADAPVYTPELADEPGYFSGVYDYYGYTPYWAPRTGPAPRWAATLGRPRDIGDVATRPTKDEG